MTKITVVTSCSAQGWEQYGRRFVQSFDIHWPNVVRLVFATEDEELLGTIPTLPLHNRLLDLVHLTNPFLTNYAAQPWASGIANSPRPSGIMPKWTQTAGYFFRYDAYKFSKKVFAIEAAASFIEQGKLFWIDADVVTFASVPMDIDAHVLPDAYSLSCLARSAYHSECGFVGYNLDADRTHAFIKAFAELYHKEGIFQLNEWHDSWVFDWLRKRMGMSTYEIPHKSQAHPFINSWLGQFMDHMKGKRKEHGRSYSQEQKQAKCSELEYWRR